jgi:alginate O-acetyltransferase complex protein AlgI
VPARRPEQEADPVGDERPAELVPVLGGGVQAPGGLPRLRQGFLLGSRAAGTTSTMLEGGRLYHRQGVPRPRERDARDGTGGRFRARLTALHPEKGLPVLGTWEFDFFYSAQFWAALAVVALLFRLLGSSPLARGAVLLASSSALLLALPRFGLTDLLLVWLISGVAFAAARLLGRDQAGPARRRWWIALGGVLAVLAFLCFFKYHVLQDVLLGGPMAGRQAALAPLPRYFALLGVSYFTFKAVHVIIESYKGSISGVGGLTFLNYMTFFPAFMSGPIHRYPDFAAQLATGRSGTLPADLAAGGERIVHGLFKKLVLVSLVFPHVLTAQARPLAALSPLEVGLGLYAQALYVYFDFSAYSDLAIGGARLMGLTLPENFNQPFLQKNIRDLWTNWHMSLTSWLVDYIYWPVVRKLRNLEWFRTRPVLLSIVGMNVTFICCGIWHGEAAHFLVWGAYHGLGISMVNLYQRQKKRIRNARLQRYFQSRASRVLGALGTFNFFAAGLALFVLDFDQLKTLFSTVLP